MAWNECKEERLRRTFIKNTLVFVPSDGKPPTKILRASLTVGGTLVDVVAAAAAAVAVVVAAAVAAAGGGDCNGAPCCGLESSVSSFSAGAAGAGDVDPPVGFPFLCQDDCDDCGGGGCELVVSTTDTTAVSTAVLTVNVELWLLLALLLL